ncbi:hypothetical protein [Hyphomonas sp.]|uniref:hypothetical protein n=1 Tax=Hyphomonas sp. TaxID=87 RepID=UPI00391A4827
MYSLTRPFHWLSPLQRLLWPLIFAQLAALKAWVRSEYGRGFVYRFGITPFGRVIYLGLITDQRRARGATALNLLMPIARPPQDTLLRRLAAAAGFKPGALAAGHAPSTDESVACPAPTLARAHPDTS